MSETTDPKAKSSPTIDRLLKYSSIVLFLIGGVGGFFLSEVRADTVNKTEVKFLDTRVNHLEELQKSYTSADKLVTKEQFAEVIKRLDEKTDRIEKKVDLLLERQMKGH